MSGPRRKPPAPATLVLEHRGRTFPIAYDHAPGADETLLYLHGLGSTRADFAGAWDVPGWDRYTLVAFDAPGCGETRGYATGLPLGVDDVVAAAEAVVDHFGLDGLTVIGHSMGGLAGLLFARRYPGRVRRFVNVEGNLGPEDCEIYSRRVFRRRFLGREEAFMEDLVRDLRASGAPGFDRVAAALRANVQDRAFFDYCRSIVEYSDHVPLLDDFVELEIPTLYVHGSENGNLGHLPRLAREGVRVRSIPDSDHFPAYSNPDAYYRTIAEFVRQTPAAPLD